MGEMFLEIRNPVTTHLFISSFDMHHREGFYMKKIFKEYLSGEFMILLWEAVLAKQWPSPCYPLRCLHLLHTASPGLKFLIWIMGMITAPTSLGPSIVKYEGNDACGECGTMVTSMFSTHVSNDYGSYSCLELSLHNRLTPPKGWNWSVINFSLTLYLAQSTFWWASATMFLLTMAWNSNAGCGTSPSNSRPIHLRFEYSVLVSPV